MKINVICTVYTCSSVMPCDAALHWWYSIYLQQRYAMWCCLTLMLYYIPAAALCHVMLPYTDDILYTCSSVMPCDAALHWWYSIYLQQRYAMWCCLTLIIYYIPAAALCHVMLPYTDDILYTCSSVMPCDAALHWWYILSENKILSFLCW